MSTAMAAFLAVACRQGHAAEFPWPIDAPRGFSSSFGEPRSGRFHMGLDFKSGGTIGCRIYALGDGDIVQVKTTPTGYGKVLYLRLDSGETLVYGHLSAFTEEVEDKLYRLRIERRTYDVEWWPLPGEARVKCGDVIAWSGDSGSWGSPHLHLEVRDTWNVPMNPCEWFAVEDTIPPDISSVVLIPLDRDSAIDGLPLPRWIDFRRSPAADPPVCTGRIGVAAGIWDRANIYHHLMGAYTVSLAVDSATVFAKKYDRITYDETYQGAYDYLPGEALGGRGTLSALFRLPGNCLARTPDDVIVCTPPGTASRQTAMVTAADFFGNIAAVSFDFIKGGRPRFLQCGITDAGLLTVAAYHPNEVPLSWLSIEAKTKDGWTTIGTHALADTIRSLSIPIDAAPGTLLRLTLADSLGVSSMPAVIRRPAGANPPVTLDLRTEYLHDQIVARIAADAVPASLPVVQVETNGVLDLNFHYPVPLSDTEWVLGIPVPAMGTHRMRIKATTHWGGDAPAAVMAELDFTVCTPAATSRLTSRDGRFTVVVPGATLVRTVPMAVEDTGVVTDHRTACLSPGYRIQFGDVPGGGPYTVTLALDVEAPSTASLYSSQDGRSWSFVTSERKGASLRGTVSGWPYVAVFDDTAAPAVTPATPRNGSVITDRRPILSARLSDDGSGIVGSDAIAFSLDGTPIYGEYDTGRNRVSYRVRTPLDTGRHTARIAVTDRAGNTTERNWSFTVQ